MSNPEPIDSRELARMDLLARTRQRQAALDAELAARLGRCRGEHLLAMMVREPEPFVQVADAI